MNDVASGPHLGADDVSGYRHVCALFDGEAEAAPILSAFVRDGLDRGERVVHLVETMDGTLDRDGGRAALASALDTGQLEIVEWSKSYVPDGSFNANRMAAFLGEVLADGSARGYPATRVIGDMEWARDGVPGVGELLEYERSLNGLIEAPHIVLCAYDLNGHVASRIEAVTAVHDAVFVGGRLQVGQARGRGIEPRRRILAAGSRLFQASGVRATGVDTIIARAGVAKATFYRHFPSKDDFIVAWLEDGETRWFDRIRIRAEARSSSPQDLVPTFFTVVGEWLEEGDYRGCPYLNTAIEITAPTHRALPIVRGYLNEIQSYLAEMIRAAGHTDADRLAGAMQTLLAGSITLGVAHRTSSFALVARDAAVRLLEAAPRG